MYERVHVCGGIRDINRMVECTFTFVYIDDEVEWVVTANHIICDFLLQYHHLSHIAPLLQCIMAPLLSLLTLWLTGTKLRSVWDV